MYFLQLFFEVSINQVKFSKFSAWFSKNGAIRQNTLHSFLSSALNFQVLFKLLLRKQDTIPTNDLCHETCRVTFIKMTPKSNFLLAHPTSETISDSAECNV